jgi:hypothetical protein
VSLAEYPYRVLSRWVADDPEAWIALGNLETRLLARWLKPVVQPAYICGLARAGTTILTEAVALHPQVATHTYSDFPCVFTPYFWRLTHKAFERLSPKEKPRERPHKDGIMVTRQSAESMEEMLWMAFFGFLHNENCSNVIDENTRNEAFAAFYRAHIQKLLLARKKSRYVSKANYNITRIPYLLSLFPDARFVIVVRNPFAHVWSLYQKDLLFRAEQERNPAGLAHMDRSGHFEFGKHRTLINTGDSAAMTSIQACFAAKDDVRGWARYWAMMQRFTQQTLSKRTEVLIVRHEDLVQNPQTKMKEVFAHYHLESDETTLHAAAAKLHEGKMPEIPEPARAIIQEETRDAAE